jgi:hypothetical protein
MEKDQQAGPEKEKRIHLKVIERGKRELDRPILSGLIRT